jgi:hypothetical protein
MALQRDEDDAGVYSTYYRSFAVAVMMMIDAVMMIHHICHGRIDTYIMVLT